MVVYDNPLETKMASSFKLISLSSHHRFPLSDEVHVFPENDRMSLPEDTVHMQELKRLHFNEDHRRPHYRYPQRKKTPTFNFSNLVWFSLGAQA